MVKINKYIFLIVALPLLSTPTFASKCSQAMYDAGFLDPISRGLNDVIKYSRGKNKGQIIYIKYNNKQYRNYKELCDDLGDNDSNIAGFLRSKDKYYKDMAASDHAYEVRKNKHIISEADESFRDLDKDQLEEEMRKQFVKHQQAPKETQAQELEKLNQLTELYNAKNDLNDLNDLESEQRPVVADGFDTDTHPGRSRAKIDKALGNLNLDDGHRSLNDGVQGQDDDGISGDSAFITPVDGELTPEQECAKDENKGTTVATVNGDINCNEDGTVAKDNDPVNQPEKSFACIGEQDVKIQALYDEAANVHTNYTLEHPQLFDEANALYQQISSMDNPCSEENKQSAITLADQVVEKYTGHNKNASNARNSDNTQALANQCKAIRNQNEQSCMESNPELVNGDDSKNQQLAQECTTAAEEGKADIVNNKIIELRGIASKCGGTSGQDSQATAKIDPTNPCSNNLTISCTSDQTTSTCISSDEVIGNKESCSYDKNQKTVKIRVRNSQEEFEFSLNGTNLSAQNTNFGNFNNSKQAIQYLIGYNINKEGKLRSHYNNVIKDEITEVPYPGGFTNFTQCQKAAGLDSWKELIKNETQRKKMVESMSKAHFYDNLMRAASTNCDLDITETGRNANICIGTLVTNDSSIINRVYSNAVSKGAECEVIARVIKENFDENKHQDSDYRDGGQTASMDGRLKCSVSNIQTIDYDECKNIVNAYNAALIGKQGLTVVQQVQTQEATFDGNQRMQEAQINAVNGIRNGTDTNNPIQRQVNGQMAAYEVQKDMINKQKSQAQTRAAIDTAAAASLVGLAQALPDKNYLVDKCENTFKSSTVLQDARKDLVTIRGQFSNAINDEQTYKERDMKYYCQDKIASMDHDFIPNKLISQPVYAIAAEFGVEAAKNQLSASMLKKRAGMIDDLMERIKNMDTGGEYAGLTQQEAIMKYCEAHPASPQCAALPGGTGTTVINPGGFNLGGEDFAANGLDGYDVEDFGEDLDTVSEIDENGDGDGSTGPTSTKVADVNKNGEKGAIAPRAKIGNGGGRGPASGGGAGGAASAGNRGGGGAPEGEKGKAQGSGQAKNTSLAYNSGKNNAYLKGGGSINSRSNKKVANPFAKLFKNSKGKVLNFRGPSSIGKQSGNLFTRISKRYGNVHENNRLLKYKYTPAK
ncbi:MAG: hypothetical protein VX341_05320 [Bdellovibrionota bacterium]|nr:hypothetical protein [Bdellovibrionota bacterium]